MVVTNTNAARREVIMRFYEQIDRGHFAAELFAENFEFFFPKYGIGRGKNSFLEMSRHIKRKSTRHHVDDFRLIEANSLVVVEGTTEGADDRGIAWHGGRTPGGRFCSVISFDGDGLIDRMYVYLDPDVAGTDRSHFVWPPRECQEW
jgi:ketosteroid isomerase-like protein